MIMNTFTNAEEELTLRVMELDFDVLDALRISRGIVVSRELRRKKKEVAMLLVKDICTRYTNLMLTNCEDVMQRLEAEYSQVFRVIMRRDPNDNLQRDFNWVDYQRKKRDETRGARHLNEMERIDAIVQNWPQVPAKELILRRCTEYFKATCYVEPPLCAVCARKKANMLVRSVDLGDVAPVEDPFNFHLLKLTDSHLLKFCSTDFMHSHPLLDGLMLDHGGIDSSKKPHYSIQVCDECLSSLQSKRIPRLALKNGLYRGALPSEFDDLTWVEEMVCSIYRTTAHVTRLYQTSSDPKDPLVFHGNTCAHDTNLVSTVSVLPRTPADMLNQLSVVFVGPGPIKKEHLRLMFRIRKKKVWDFLCWLRIHNRVYRSLLFDMTIMDQYPEDDILPGLEEMVLVDTDSNARKVFEEETAGLSEHPADLMQNSDPNVPKLFVESMGVSDPEGDRISGRSYTAAALRNLVSDSDANKPDLIIPHGSQALSEYSNPSLFPGMFPTLFPYGHGGFEDAKRPVSISFRSQAEYFIDLADRAFRYHRYYMFVALNIIQRRFAHLNTFFTVKKSNFSQIAEKLVKLSPALIQSVASHLENEGHIKDLSPSEKEVINLLNKVNTIAAKIPGSQASRLSCRNEIRSYMGYFGIGHIYLTMNPNPGHSPIFQVMCGDKSVDLFERYPLVPPSTERALRLAKDPVAAADFFEFVIRMFVQHLLGWDFDKGKSSEEGGILGHIRAFYGANELTERAVFHGHFIIWLLGGLNPIELHAKLKDSEEFRNKYFEFYEAIIHHHLPNTDTMPDPGYEPRTQRPPLPTMVDDWDEVFITEVKLCGETLQRHTCRKVCHKYNHPDSCRFQFPHEEVQKSFFDPETNSIILLCLDGNVNYFNPYILVFCRHNHDIKSILSGRAAKAAMFYITDYITKLDLKTHEMLSLLSRSIAGIPEERIKKIDGEDDKAKARMLLHRCLSQFTRQQQIHAQQAARYLRNLGDSTSSHKTVPMMSSLILMHASKNVIPLNENENKDAVSDDDEEEAEQPRLKVQVDQDGKLREVTQVDDYILRGTTLDSMCFYDFVRYVNKRRKSGGSSSTRKNGYTHHCLKPEHPQHSTHELILHEGDTLTREVVPRVFGCSIPRAGSEKYAQFMLVHFKPWSNETALVQASSGQIEFETYQFAPEHRRIMSNWEELYECQDERDAERLRKQDSISKESRALTKSLQPESDEDPLDLTADPKGEHLSNKDREVLKVLSDLKIANFFKEQTGSSKKLANDQTMGENLPIATVLQLKVWTKARKEQEQGVKQTRRNMLDPNNAESGRHQHVPDTTTFQAQIAIQEDRPPETLNPNANAVAIPGLDAKTDLIEHVATSHELNPKQAIAFRIAAMKFIEIFRTLDPSAMEYNAVTVPSLKMLMTGPGGTGKTHVVLALQSLMSIYRCGHRIRYLAPTGTAASLIDGMTIHSGLGIRIMSRNQGKGARNAGEDQDDLSVIVDVRKRKEIRAEWKDVLFLLVDEVSLVSQELLCELDYALQYAKESKVCFGGINVIFAGDFYQYPPVMGNALYTPIGSSTKESQNEIKRRLGRLTWKMVDDVVILDEQMRMRDDLEYAAAVMRLRERKCNHEDVELFNTRAIRSTAVPDGVDMGLTENEDATMIVTTNLLRQAVNNQKAIAKTSGPDSPEVVICAAKDEENRRPLEGMVRDDLLSRNLTTISTNKNKDKALPGKLPLFEGMPVVLRIQNISTELKLTNGSQGVVRKIETERNLQDPRIVHPTCVIVDFSQSTVQLPSLPKGYYPVVPQKWAFSAIMGEPPRNTVISRQQLPIQPAFAITGHGAQGKTLPKVLVNLGEGGFPAYVAASRPRTRQGLCITLPVKLENLNKRLPFNLKFESKRLEALATNTLIKYAFETGELVNVPDPEFERTTSDLVANDHTKRKFNHGDNTDEPRRKKPRLTSSKDQIQKRMERSTDVPVHAPEPGITVIDPPFHGCLWDTEDWSCAYDAVFMSFFTAYFFSSPAWRLAFSSMNLCTAFLSSLFEILLEPVPLKSSSEFDVVRDQMRDELSNYNPVKFQRHGRVNCAVDDLIQWIIQDAAQVVFSHTSNCGSCGISVTLNHSRDLCAYHTTWTEYAEANRFNPNARSASIQTWVNLIASILSNQERHCGACGAPTNVDGPFASVTPPWITFEIEDPDVLPRTIPSTQLTLRSQADQLSHYSLRSVIYFAHEHFSIRLIDNTRQVWTHDGMLHSGVPQLDGITAEAGADSRLMTQGDRTARFYLYTRSN